MVARPSIISSIETPKTDQSDQDIASLTKAMKRLDESAYREFFQRYYRRLWYYLITVAKGDERFVEDAIQTAFTRVVKHIRIFNTEDALWNWLRLIARNAYFDCHRKESALQRALRRIGLGETETAIDSESDTERSEERQSLLNAALDFLSDDERNLIHQKYIEGKRYSEIAYETQLTKKAVESKLTRIRRKLKALMGKAKQNG